MKGILGVVENKPAKRLISFIDEFRKLNAEMQAQQISLFLHVVAQPELTIKEYAQRAGLGDGGPISRNIEALSDQRKVVVKGQPEIVRGHGLIETYEDPLDRRFKRVKPTARGMRVYSTLVQLLGL
ncbi:MarR family transcriptional regulator [Mesorhizobium sp. M2D.F.Ca.ET.223.01.1.1]|uniref:MarR family transcriptional regulator n=1 Tax=Mesorhizobium sp. M2D.F.Ca.ET.223.01.1.1 TaxID=2563940 RepID=UPI001092FA30|nr:MarR family transcriptional regulator [Mesorhizobium sp. M2D.F.Ca.ET.223.01.1.1]TGR84554.1 MarR family transcriptional regulator [Mesorhizobium sp. M2D.F.Ca.ET.223.01.1.1]TGT65964.1 MarR family transcriptional regulator [bacterium M00.F.Ca.ET.159.01.1.1]TGT79649.1 MarR family transcriptional regulator [bacterium M00.F.Ca.ET.157.01.1.1]